MPLTENQRIKLHLAISAGFSNKDDWNKFFKDETLELRIDFSNYPRKDELDKIQCQYQQKSQNCEIKILIFEAPHADLCLNQEYDSIISSIKSSIHGNSFKIFRERVISADEISQQLANRKPDIVHFSGHGLEDGSFSLGGNETVKPKFLEAKFKFYTGQVKCVIFNTCYSEKIAEIISPHIDYVISMNNSILDDKAIHFAKSFYSGLVQAYSDGIDIFLTGFVEGIIALTNDDYSQDLIPVLKVGYKQAILNYIKKIDAESKIDDFIKKISPNLLTNKLFNEFYNDYSYPIKKNDLTQLVKIIREYDWNLVKSHYRYTLPQDSTIDNSELNNLTNIDSIIDILRTKYPFVNDNKVPSILEFAKNLAREFTKDEKIKSWVEEVSSKLNIPISVQPKIVSKLPEFYTYLLILVDAEGDTFNLRAEYLIEDENLNKLRQEPFNLPGHNEQTGMPIIKTSPLPSGDAPSSLTLR